ISSVAASTRRLLASIRSRSASSVILRSPQVYATGRRRVGLNTPSSVSAARNASFSRFNSNSTVALPARLPSPQQLIPPAPLCVPNLLTPIPQLCFKQPVPLVPRLHQTTRPSPSLPPHGPIRASRRIFPAEPVARSAPRPWRRAYQVNPTSHDPRPP